MGRIQVRKQSIREITVFKISSVLRHDRINGILYLRFLLKQAKHWDGDNTHENYSNVLTGMETLRNFLLLSHCD